jgi:hypothetical protein
MQASFRSKYTSIFAFSNSSSLPQSPCSLIFAHGCPTLARSGSISPDRRQALCSFFLLIEGIQLRPGYQRRQSSIPLRELRGAQQFHWINNEMLTWLSPTIGISVAGLLPFATAVSELFNNVTDHSTAQSGWAFVQHFPKTGKVTISISDWGRGIPNEVRRVRRNISDAEAIIEATKQGFSSKGSPKKRGAGLDYLLTTVVGVNGGTVEIWSNFGHVLFARDRGRVSAYPQAFDAFSVGTTIDITFIVTNIVDVPDQAEEFEW